MQWVPTLGFASVDKAQGRWRHEDAHLFHDHSDLFKISLQVGRTDGFDGLVFICNAELIVILGISLSLTLSLSCRSRHLCLKVTHSRHSCPLFVTLPPSSVLPLSVVLNGASVPRDRTNDN